MSHQNPGPFLCSIYSSLWSTPVPHLNLLVTHWEQVRLSLLYYITLTNITWTLTGNSVRC
jgi:hypothetical protein